MRVVAVPFEATVSFGAGTAAAPQRIAEASLQVDLDQGPWQEGVALEPGWERVLAWNETAGAAVASARAGGDTESEVDTLCEMVLAHVKGEVGRILDCGAIPAVLGGDHSVPVGGVLAAAERFPGLGVLHVDAHADLRDAYEGFRYSHASAIRNMLTGDIGALVSVGLRDVGLSERATAAADARVHWWEDGVLAERAWSGEPWPVTCVEILAPLPQSIWITWDVDGLDPSLCPHTGTPVPGGLRWREALGLVRAVAQTGRRVVGFDVGEVGAGDWDANVGARLLWALAGCAVETRANKGGTAWAP